MDGPLIGDTLEHSEPTYRVLSAPVPATRPWSEYTPPEHFLPTTKTYVHHPFPVQDQPGIEWGYWQLSRRNDPDREQASYSGSNLSLTSWA